MTFIPVPADIMEMHPRCYLLEVTGDCMAPTISPGSIVAIDPDTLPPKDGSEIGAVEVDGELYLCRPMQIMGQVVMFHDNKRYRSVTIRTERVKVIGAVVWVEQMANVRGDMHEMVSNA